MQVIEAQALPTESLQEVVGILTESHRLKAGGESIDILF
jgi:hypothetical protein